MLNIAKAQAPFLAATANKSTVALNEQFQVTFTLNASGRSFQGPDLKEFIVLSGPNQSTSMQLVNGNFSQSISYSYFLQPKNTGNFKIGPASIEVEGKRIASNVIQITVAKGNPQTGGGQGQAQAQDAGLSDKNIFLRASVNRTTVMQGEALVVSFRLYTNVNIVNYGVNKMPALTGFWNQDVELPDQLQLTNEVVDGVNYRVGEIKKIVLFPQQSGQLTIDPMEVKCIARVKVKSRSSDPWGLFDDPFFGGGVRDIPYEFRSQSIKVNVKPLPANAPDGFQGAVGQFNFEARLDKNETKANEAINLKIKINGSGNLKLVPAPEINFPADLESYDPKISENFRTGAEGLSGSKSYEYLLIPRHEGEYELEPISFTWFDLEKKQYITRSAGPFKIKVGKGSGTGSAATIVDAGTKSEFRELGQDIRYIKVNSPDFGTASVSNFYGSPLFFTLALSPLLLFGGLMIRQRREERLRGDATAMRVRKATSQAQKRLALAGKLMREKQNDKFYEEVLRSLWGYTSDKFLVPVSELSKEKVSEILSERKLDTALISDFIRTIDECEMARYAGSVAIGDPANLYRQAERVINEIEAATRS
jgi:hypothetical protein